MSFQAMTWAVEQNCENSGQKIVLIMLANYCNSHSGQCNPSHARLAKECSMSVSSLKSHLSRLSELGLITIQRRSSDGVSLPNQYHINIEPDVSEVNGGGSESGWGVGQNLTGGGSESGYKPGIEPGTKTNKDTRDARPLAKTTRKQHFDPTAYPLPDYVDPSMWREWNAIRKSKGNPLLLPEQCAMQLRKLERFEALFPGGANESLYRCVEEGWIGLREPDKQRLDFTTQQFEMLLGDAE